MSEVRTSTLEHVGLLEITRPPTNHFNRHVIEQLVEGAAELVQDGARALVLMSEGKHFCAGADFAVQDEDRVTSSIALYRSAVRLFRIPVPVVAAVQGAAVGGGMGLALSADLRVASPGSRFHPNFVRLGFHPGFGLSESLRFAVGDQAAYRMLMSGRRVGGEEAARLGLVDVLVEEGRVREAAVELATTMASHAPLAVQSVKRTHRRDLADRIERMLDHELIEQTWLWQTEDSRRGIAASLDRTTPEFLGR